LGPGKLEQEEKRKKIAIVRVEIDTPKGSTVKN
jgi:hypothetical protein